MKSERGGFAKKGKPYLTTGPINVSAARIPDFLILRQMSRTTSPTSRLLPKSLDLLHSALFKHVQSIQSKVPPSPLRASPNVSHWPHRRPDGDRQRCARCSADPNVHQHGRLICIHANPKNGRRILARHHGLRYVSRQLSAPRCCCLLPTTRSPQPSFGIPATPQPIMPPKRQRKPSVTAADITADPLPSAKRRATRSSTRSAVAAQEVEQPSEEARYANAIAKTKPAIAVAKNPERNKKVMAANPEKKAPATTEKEEKQNGGELQRRFWLMKAEPESRIEKGKDVKFSIDDLAACKEPQGWDGGTYLHLSLPPIRALSELTITVDYLLTGPVVLPTHFGICFYRSLTFPTCRNNSPELRCPVRLTAVNYAYQPLSPNPS
jgi:hypothetical protein